MIETEKTSEYIEFIKTTMLHKKGNSYEEYVKGVDCVQLNTLMKEHAKSEGKSVRGVNEATVVMSAFIMGNIMDRILFSGMERVQNENGSIMVWLKHQAFVDRLKGIDLKLYSFRKYLEKLTKIKVISHTVRGVKSVPKHYYCVTEKGIDLLSIDTLGKYLRVVEKIE